MNVKPTLSGLIALFALSPAVAQDRLYTRDGAVQEVKIKEVGTRTVIYKKWNNPDGPDFELNVIDQDLKEDFLRDSMHVKLRGFLSAIPQVGTKINVSTTFHLLANPLR